MQKNDTLKLGVALLAIVSAAIIIMATRSPAPKYDNQNKQAYFYDLGTAKLFTAPAQSVPPIDAPGGAGKGVRAMVVGCESCAETSRRIVYIEKLDDEARAIATSNAPPQPGQHIARMERLQHGTLVATPPATPGAEPTWHRRDTPAGLELDARAMNLCGARTRITCTPE